MIDGRISKRRELTLGADPEMFVFSGNKLLPAFEFLPHKDSKENIYWDGFQAEWKYDHDGAHCQNNLVKYTRERLIQLTAIAKTAKKDARLSLDTVVRVPKEILESARPEHVELGCQPSYNAYWMKGKPVYDPRKLPYRFAGGHMHFGTWTPQRPNYDKIVRTLDSILGVWAVGVAQHMDSPIRRQYYGLAGEYRKPKYKSGYGVEYRSLSNFWLASPGILQLTWDIGRLSVRLAGSRYRKLWASFDGEAVEVINSCDVKRAGQILRRNEPMFRWMLKQVYRSPEAIDAAIGISHVGLHSVVKDPEDFKANWHFEESWIPNGGRKWARWETSC